MSTTHQRWRWLATVTVMMFCVVAFAAAQDNTSRFSNVIVATNATVAGGLSVGGALTNAALTASRAVATGADKSLASSATTATELGFVSGVTSAIQAQIDGKQASLGYTPVNKAGDTMTGGLVISNSVAGDVPITINHASGATADMIKANVGGTSKWRADKDGNAFAAGASTSQGTTVGMSMHGGTAQILMGYSADAFSGITPSYAHGIVTTHSGGSKPGNTMIFRIWNQGTDSQYNNNPSFTALTLAGDGTLTSAYLASTSSTLQVGADSATPVAQTFNAADGVGTDKNGASLTVQGGQSTGAGGGGDFDIATSLTADATGSTANSYSLRYHANAKHIALTHNTATTIETFSLAANKILGGELVVTTYATNSTPHIQARTTSLVFQAVAVSTTITGTIDIAKAGTLAASSGTMTETYTLLDNGNNTFSIQLAANSDLSTPTERCKVVVTALNGNAAVTITDP